MPDYSTHRTKKFGKKCGCITNSKKTIRLVSPFSYQSLQKSTIVHPPVKIYPKQRKWMKTTLFRYYFKRGDIPIRTSRLLSTSKLPDGTKIPVQWFCNPDKLDYCYYLPIMMDGLGETDSNLRELAYNATRDLLLRNPKKVLPVLPQLIFPLKRALNTKVPTVIVKVLKIIQNMVLLDHCIGQALVPFFRTLLPVCNLFKETNVSIGIQIDAEHDNRIGNVIEDTLQILEHYGGPDAYINIKYMIPTYESRVMN